MHPTYFPTAVPCYGASLPSTGSSPVASSPASNGTIKTLRLPAVPFASLRFLRSAIPREHTALFVSSVATACQATDLELITRYLRPGILSVETTGPPKFLGNPMVHLRMFFDPGRTACSSPKRSSRAVPAKKKTKTPTFVLFRGSIAWLLDSLSTLRSAGCPDTTQDSLPAVGYTLPDGFSYPRGSDEKFHPLPCRVPFSQACLAQLFLRCRAPSAAACSQPSAVPAPCVRPP